jgi:predicted Ser/Thr protein kinase
MLHPDDVVAGKYRIIGEVGRGSYGVVFKAIQRGIEREVALKTLLPQAVGTEESQRFEREARLVSRLTHPHIITLYDFGEHEGLLYMVMEFVEGRSLGELIRDEAPLPVEKVRGLIYQMLDALHYAHDQGVVHRDLKPENIWLIRNPSMTTDSLEMLKILDFGIAKVLRGQNEASALDTLTQTGFALGTPQYMSPENITGDVVTHKTDLYAVGLIMFEMLTGRPPFDTTTPHAAMVSHLRDEPPPLPKELGLGAWQRAIDLCLQKQPDDRIDSARALREVLEADEHIVGPGASSRKLSTVPSPSRSSQWLGALALVIIAMLSGVIFWQWYGGLTGTGDRAGEIVVTSEGVVGDEGSDARRKAGQEGEEGKDEPEQQGGAGASERGTASVAVEPELVSEEERPVSRGTRGLEDRGGARTVKKAADEDSGDLTYVSLRIRSLPENARVSMDGRPIGTTPIVRELPLGDLPIRVDFSLIGYRDNFVTIVPDRDQTIEVKMERGRLQLTP